MASKEGGMLGDAKHNDVSAKTALRCRHKSVAYAVVDKERRLASGRRISVAGAPRILGIWHFLCRSRWSLTRPPLIQLSQWGHQNHRERTKQR